MNPVEISWRGKKLKGISRDSDAYQELMSWALKGDRSAQYTIGVWYEYIEGQPKTAQKWYKKATEQGHEAAGAAYNRLNAHISNASSLHKPSINTPLSGATIAGTTYGNISNASTIYGQDVFHAQQGHGYAAEQAEHLVDYLHRRDASLPGANLAKDGADRIVNGTNIQTKYCETGAKCVESCFRDGQFRYVNADGTPMQIEVPSDKYETAVKAMEDRIKKGEVPGVTNPAEAKAIIKKGHFTYLQAKNIAKAGTVESIIFDSVNGAIIATSSFGFSATLTFATSVWNGESLDVALKNATYSGLKVSGIAFATAVLTGQLTKAGLNTVLINSSEALTKALGPKACKVIAKAFRNGKNIYGAAAMKSTAKLLRTNVVTSAASVIVLSSVDVVNIFRSRISGKQLFKNVTTTTVSVASGAAGWVGGTTIGSTAGAAIGGFLGSVVPGAGTIIGAAVGTKVGGVIGGFAGSFAAGSVSGKATNKVLGTFIEDDADEMIRIIEGEFKVLAVDYLLNQKEAEATADKLKETLHAGTLKDMFAAKNKKRFAQKLLLPSVEDVVSQRTKIKLPSDEQMQESLRLVLEEIADAEEETESITVPPTTKQVVSKASTSVENNFRLIVNDVFNMGEKGVAIVGAVENGCVNIGDTLTLVHKNGNSYSVIIVGVAIGQMLVDSAQAGDDVSLLLKNVSAQDIQVGDILRNTY